MAKSKCECPLLQGADPYFAGFLELDLGINRVGCVGPIETEIGTLVCRAYQNRLKEYAAMMQPPDIEAEKFLQDGSND